MPKTVETKYFCDRINCNKEANYYRLGTLRFQIYQGTCGMGQNPDDPLQYLCDDCQTELYKWWYEALKHRVV